MIMRMRKLNEIFPTDNFRATRRAWEFNKVAVMQMLIEKTTGQSFRNRRNLWKRDAHVENDFGRGNWAYPRDFFQIFCSDNMVI